MLGLGNLVHTDDGLGVHAILGLQMDARVPAGVTLMDGGTQGLALIPHISGFEKMLVIDAIDVGEKPGTLLRLEGPAVENLPGKPSVHQLGFADLMITLKLLGDTPPEVVLIGMQPESTAWSAELSNSVKASLPALYDAVIDQCKAWAAVAA